ncbi:MAG TPA: TetR/AcrR family transcriptional regulator [Casimicrobiaceae bacterium]
MPRKPPRRTRERIVETALVLFNRDGEPHVTTAHIADEMNISPGNLYYHFRNKEEIVGELHAAFERAVLPLLALPENRSPGIEDLWLLLHLLFERMWAHRFLYRDLDDITSRHPAIGQGIAALHQRLRGLIVAICEALRADGILHADDRAIDALATNVVVVATCWMSFQRVLSRGPGARAAPGDDPSAMHFERAAAQVLALIAPFLRERERAHLERLSEQYL